jgi:TfoX/Sxy family transcriptional regulator of competence genes
VTWSKSPEALVALFDACLPREPGVERRQMFGYSCAFVNGNLACGLHQDQVLVRLPEARRTELLATTAARVFEPMPGRPMREYLLVPPDVVVNPSALGAWLAEAVAYARSVRTEPKRRRTSKAPPPARRGARPRRPRPR